MYRFNRFFVPAITCIAFHGLLAHAQTKRPSPSNAPASGAEMLRQVSAIPVSFAENNGQADPSSRFIARGRQQTLLLKNDEAVLIKNGAALTMKLAGANPKPRIAGEDPSPEKLYYATPATRGKLTPLSTFSRVKYSAVYPGVDLVYHGNDRQLEFDFVIAPNADPDQVRLSFAGADKIALDQSGEVSLRVGAEEVRLRKPFIYQEHDGIRTEIVGGYVLRDKQVSFQLAAYNHEIPLIIDPVILFGGYLGTSSSGEAPAQIKANLFDEIYVAINTDSIGEVSATQIYNIEPPQAGFDECFVTKLSYDGSTILYTVVFGGVRCVAMEVTPGKVHLSMGNGGSYLRTLSEDAQGQPSSLDLLYGNGPNTGFDSLEPAQFMKADAAGNLYLIITNPNLSLPQVGNQLLKVDTNGNLVSTVDVLTTQVVNNFIYDQVTDLDVDDQGDAYVLGTVRNPIITTTPGSFQPTKFSDSTHTDGFLLRVNASTFAIDYATYLGWTANSFVEKVAVDRSSGNVFVVGTADSVTLYLLDLDLTLSGHNQQVGFDNLGAAQTVTAESLVVLPGGSPAATYNVFDNNHPFLVNSFYPARFDQDVRAFLRIYSPGMTQLLLSTFLDATASSTSFGPLLAPDGQFLYAAMATTDGNLGTSGSFHPSPEGGYDVLVRSIDVTDVVAPTNGLPAVTLTPSALNLTVVTPTSGVDLPLTCGQLFTCAIEYLISGTDVPVGTAWWNGPNVNVVQAGGLPSTTVHLPGTGTYQFTLTVKDPQGFTGSGTLTVNVNDQNTQVSSNPQTITLTDELFNSDLYRGFGNAHPATISLPAVQSAGLTWLQSRSDLTPVPPAGLQAGSPPFYYEIHTNSSFTKPAILCLDTTGMSFADPELAQVYELQSNVWTALPTNNQNGTLCVSTNLPSVIGGDFATTIAVFYPQVSETTLTKLPIQDAPSNPSYMALDGNLKLLYVSEDGGDAAIRRVNLNDNSSIVLLPSDPSIKVGPVALDPNSSYLYYVKATAPPAPDEVVIRRDLVYGGETIIAGGAACCDFPTPGQSATGGYLSDITSLAADFAGNVFLVTNGGAFRVDSDGSWRPIFPAPIGDFSFALAFDAYDYLLVGGIQLFRLAPGPDGTVDGTGSAKLVAGIPGPQFVGYPGPWAGDGQAATQAALAIDRQMIVAPDGAVIFVDGGTRVRRISPGADGVVNGDADETIQTVAGFYGAGIIAPSPFATSSGGPFWGLTQDPGTGDIYTTNSVDSIESFGLSPITTIPGGDQQADLVLTASGIPNSVNVGDVLTYSPIVVTNSGPLSDTGVQLTLVTTSGVTLQSASLDQGSCSATSSRIVICTIGEIIAGSSVHLSIAVKPQAAGTLLTNIYVTASYPDLNLANNSVNLSTTVLSTNLPPVVTAPADITIPATEQGGARGNVSALLHNFLLAATATDDHDANPQQLPTQANFGAGPVNVSDQTLFGVGTTLVTFSFKDSSNAIGTATAHLTVQPAVGGAVSSGTTTTVPTDSSNNPLPLLLTFSGITQPGLVTGSVLMSPPAPPANFQFNGAVYDISTTALYTPPITICFVGSGFTATDRLLHYEGGMWVDKTITGPPTSLPTKVCGVVNSLSPFGVARPITVQLTTAVSPSGAGTVTPTSGPVTINSIVSLKASASPGYSFVNWTGPVANSHNAATTVTPGGDTSVTANFTELATSMSGNITAKTGTANARVWTVVLTNNGPGAANAAAITSFALTQVAGPACTPVVATSMPASAGNIAPSGSGSVNVTINFTGCSASSRFTSTIQFSANSGIVSGSIVRYNQFE